MGGHVRSGGDYADEGIDGNLPQTHVPLRGIAGCAQEARARGARFVFSGILADQVMPYPQWRARMWFRSWI